MGWTVSTFVIVVFASGAVALAAGVATLRTRPDPMVPPVAALMFAVGAWAIPHGISLGYADVSQVALWHRLRYPGTVAAPVAYLVVALRYAGHDRWLSRRTYAALSIVPVLTLVILWTNPLHGLFWRSLAVASVGGASVLVPTVGPWYWVNLGYLYLLTIGALAVLGAVVVRSGPIYRKQAALMFVGGIVPLATNGAVVFVVDTGPMVDLTTTALAVTGVTFVLALFRFDLLDVRPVARNRLVEELDDGVVVVGPNGRIRDFNPTAARVLDGLAVDRPAGTVLPSTVATDGSELVVETGTGERRFRTRSTPLHDERGRETGRIIYLNDVTDIVQHEQRLEVLNRVLRHNVRNELAVVSGHFEVLAERVGPEDQRYVEEAEASARRVVELAEKARHLERTLQARGATTVVPVATVARQVVADRRCRHPDATITYDPPGDGSEDEGRDAHARVVDEGLFETALGELIENAVIHSDRDAPAVIVSVDVDVDGDEADDGDRVRVRVVDDGPGIPETERMVLETGTESQLEHGSGLGLWLVEWTVTLSGGELSFGTSDPGGSVVTLTLRGGDSGTAEPKTETETGAETGHGDEEEDENGDGEHDDRQDGAAPT